MNQIMDFYYSEKSFHQINLIGAQFGLGEIVCEALVDGEWKIFTEQITKGDDPLSVQWGDLIYLGSGGQTRYTNAIKWVKENTDKIRVEDGKMMYVQ